MTHSSTVPAISSAGDVLVALEASFLSRFVSLANVDPSLVALMLAGFPLGLLFPRLLFAALIETHLQERLVMTVCSPPPLLALWF
jgi:hypothetical protein